MTDLRSYEGIGGGQLDPSGTTLAPTPAAAPKYKYLALNITQTAAHFDGYFPKIVDIFMLDGTGGDASRTNALREPLYRSNMRDSSARLSP